MEIRKDISNEDLLKMLEGINITIKGLKSRLEEEKRKAQVIQRLLNERKEQRNESEELSKLLNTPILDVLPNVQGIGKYLSIIMADHIALRYENIFGFNPGFLFDDIVIRELIFLNRRQFKDIPKIGVKKRDNLVKYLVDLGIPEERINFRRR